MAASQSSGESDKLSSTSNTDPMNSSSDSTRSSIGGASGSGKAGDRGSSGAATKQRINPISPFDEDILDIPTESPSTAHDKRRLSMDSASLSAARRSSISSTSSALSLSSPSSAVPEHLLASGPGGDRDNSGSNNGYELPLSEHLRPGIVVRIIGAVIRADYIVYVIRVCDVQSGIEWRTERRFREFQVM